MTLLIILWRQNKASTNPTDKTTINKNKSYFGAFDVILKILFGSRNLNIILNILFLKLYYEKLSDQE